MCAENWVCTWPDDVNCEMDERHLEDLRPDTRKFLYMTFDDGPWQGTTEVLDILKRQGIKATFFINTDKMFDKVRESYILMCYITLHQVNIRTTGKGRWSLDKR